MNSLKHNLDDFFADARVNDNITPAENLLKAGSTENSFKGTVGKIVLAGIASLAAISFFLLKQVGPDVEKGDVVKEKTENIQSEDFKKENIITSALQSPKSTAKPPTLKRYSFERVVIIPPVEAEIPASEDSEQFQSGIKEISEIPLIHLRNSDLNKLGIEVKPGGDIIMTFIYNNLQTTSSIYDNTITHKPLIGEVDCPEVLKGKAPSFIPMHVTDISGKTDVFTAPRQVRDSLNRLSRLIPFKAGNFIVWYAPSDEVLKALPESVCNTIHAELNGNNITPAEVAGEEYPTSGYCYLDLCEKMNGAILCSKVFPNPSVGKQTFSSFELSEERNLLIALYDLSGRKLRELSALKTFEKGKHEEELSLVGIEKGIYLIAIITDRGEKLSRRIIID